MRRRHSLRFRVVLAFAGLGALLSLLLALGIWFAAHDVSWRLMDETLDAELADYMARRARNPYSLPPATASLTGYLIRPGAPPPDLPATIATLPPGRHEVVLDAVPQRVAIADQGGERFVLLFNETRQQRREQHFFGYLIAGAGLMTLFATLVGLWFAGKVIAPVTEFARAVSSADPSNPPRLSRLARPGDPEDEIDELARAFDRYLARLAAFIERESRFAADASHELRTPLAVIRGAAEVLTDDPGLTDAQRQRVARIERAAAEMTELIAALLLLAREEDSPVEKPCDAAQLAEDCIERYRSLALSRGTTLALQVDGAVALPVPAALFAIALANLVRNAAAHTENGGIRVELDSERLVVRDSGSGIDADVRQHVFERYYRGPESAGAGIGLSLVKRICERLGWKIDLESHPTEGATATLNFRP
jgi:signal transduction histidine kinase